MKKKIVSLALVASLLALVIVGGTLAYFTDSEAKTNTFVVGNVDITLTESDWAAPSAAAPGILYEKNPIVTNVGANDAWIRVDVTFTDYEAISEDPNAMADLTDLLVGLDEEHWTIVDADPAPVGDTITYSFYYYEILTAATDVTEPLFTGVKFPAAWGNAKMEALSEDFTITVTANAIQTADGLTSAALAFAQYTGTEEQPANDAN